MNLLEYMLDLYEQTPEHKLFEKNMEEEMAYNKGKITSEEVNEYIRKNPDDPIGGFGKLLLKYQDIRPLHEWDAEKMLEISSVTEPLIDGIKELVPDIKVRAELDALTNTAASVLIEIPKYQSLVLWGKLYGKFQQVVQKADGFNISPMNDGKIEVSFDFKNVKKPMK